MAKLEEEFITIKLLDGRFGKISDFFVLSIFPFSQFSKDINPFETLEDVTFFSIFSWFSVASMS